VGCVLFKDILNAFKSERNLSTLIGDNF